ncbi:hypothetical protein CaCOL14_006771 [Colletotrichum acutatum]|uniref:Tyrosinase copper-binding domain-containing protein n=1 Tax=Glomerella acutata TaxID=27357 RepID=A0AAD8UFY3_GLOAC|nr:uncharacterized protein BDZ83DRAFT_586267 [Colletotrichum acutatum]KAK1718065.1 hypothetical protein BDZ83DRAFT_586267 [Colletotrichum acutatum]
MTSCKRWAWLFGVIVVLLTLTTPGNAHHKKKPDTLAPPPAPIPRPSISQGPRPRPPPTPVPIAPPGPKPKPTVKPTSIPKVPPAPVPIAPPAPKPKPNPPKAKPEFTEEEINNGTALAKLNKRALENVRRINVPQKHPISNITTNGTRLCQGEGVLMRKEWRKLTVTERKSFITAVQCIMNEPVISDPKRVPMAKSLYDDFVAVHYTSFRNTHLTASFFAWHRYYLASFEQRLRTQCRYKGALPYWEWGLDVNNPAASPLFDGTELSLGSDGEFIPHDGLQLRQPFSNNTIKLKPGTGGGCIKSGPFQNMTVHIGPAALAQYGITKPFNVTDPLQDLPRCLKRDLNKDVAQRFNSFRNTTTLILEQTNIKNFSSLLQGDDRFFPNTLGIHGGGHFIIGGDPGADGLIAPGDPAFWVHQAQVDRVYWIWQNLDFKNRQGVFGTMTLQDNPKSPEGSVEDDIDLTPLNSPVKIKNLMNTVSGAPLCYMYE